MATGGLVNPSWDEAKYAALGQGLRNVAPDTRTLREKLEFKRRIAEVELGVANEAMAILDAHPEFEQFLDLFKAQGL